MHIEFSIYFLFDQSLVSLYLSLFLHIFDLFSDRDGENGGERQRTGLMFSTGWAWIEQRRCADALYHSIGSLCHISSLIRSLYMLLVSSCLLWLSGAFILDFSVSLFTFFPPVCPEKKNNSQSITWTSLSPGFQLVCTEMDEQPRICDFFIMSHLCYSPSVPLLRSDWWKGLIWFIFNSVRAVDPAAKRIIGFSSGFIAHFEDINIKCDNKWIKSMVSPCLINKYMLLMTNHCCIKGTNTDKV